MPYKIPKRLPTQSNEDYINQAKQVIKAERPDLDDNALDLLAEYEISNIKSEPIVAPKVVEQPKVAAKPIASPKPQTFRDLAKTLKPKEDYIQKFVPQMQAPTMGNPNTAAATIGMLEKFIPKQQAEEPVVLNPVDLEPIPQREQPTINVIGGQKPIVDETKVNVPKVEPYVQNKQAEDIRQGIIERNPIEEPTKDIFDIEADKQIPNSSDNQKKVYAEVLRNNDDKIRTFEAQKASNVLSDEAFKSAINYDDLMKPFTPQTKQEERRQEVAATFSSAPKVGVREYVETPQFKIDVLKRANNRPERLKEAANELIKIKEQELQNAPSRWNKTTQKFAQYLNDDLGVVGKVANVPLSFASGTTEGLVDIAAFLASGINTARQVAENELSGTPYNVGDVYAEKNKNVQQMASGMKPNTVFEGNDPYSGFINDVASSVGYITSGGSVMKPTTIFDKLRKTLAFGNVSAAAKGVTEADMIAAKVAGKTLGTENKIVQEFTKALQGKPANFVSNVLDNTVHNSVIMWSPTFQANVEKYKGMGFNDEQAQERAYGSTFANMLALSLPNAVHASKSPLINNILSKENKWLATKQGLKQSAHFTRDMTALRLYESNRDRNAMMEEGIDYDGKALDVELGEQLLHAKNDAAIGLFLGYKAGRKMAKSPIQAQAMAEALEDPSLLGNSIREGVSRGTISKEQAKGLQDFMITIAPAYEKAKVEVNKEGKPKYNSAQAVQVAIENTKLQQAVDMYNIVSKQEESAVTYGTDPKTGEQKEIIVYKHKDGNYYDTPEPEIQKKKQVALGVIRDAKQVIAQIEKGTFVRGRIVGADEMEAIAKMNSLNAELKKGQAEKIRENPIYVAEEMDVMDFAENPEIKPLVEEIIASGVEEIPADIKSNEPIINDKGEVIEGRQAVAHAIVRMGGKMTFMKPIEAESVAEIVNEAVDTKLGVVEPNIEGLKEENDIIAVDELADVYNKHLEANEGDFNGAVSKVMQDAIERGYSKEEAIDRLKRVVGENTIPDMAAEWHYNEAKREKVAEKVESKGGLSEKLRKAAELESVEETPIEEVVVEETKEQVEPNEEVSAAKESAVTEPTPEALKDVESTFLGDDARKSMSKEIDAQILAKENELIEKQTQDIENAKKDLGAIKNGDKSVIDQYVKKSGYKLVTKEVIANNPKSELLKKSEGKYYNSTGASIQVKTAGEIAVDGATKKANSKATGSKAGANQYVDVYNALTKLSKGEIAATEAKAIFEKAGLKAPKAVEDLLAPKAEKGEVKDVESTAKALEVPKTLSELKLNDETTQSLEKKLKQLESERTNKLIENKGRGKFDDRLKDEVDEVKRKIYKRENELATRRNADLEASISDGSLLKLISENKISAENARLLIIESGIEVPTEIQSIVDKNKQNKKENKQSIIERDTDFLGNDKEAYMVNNDKANGVRTQDDVNYYKANVKRAIDKGQYEKDIADGKMTANDAKTIIESYGLKAPKAVEDLLAPKTEKGEVKEVEKEQVEPESKGEQNLKTENHQVYYNGKVVDMGYIPNKKEQFKFGSQRITDNLGTGGNKETVGYIKTPDGKIYEVSRSNKTAKQIIGENLKEAQSKFAPTTNESKSLSAKTRELAKKLNEQHEKEINDPNSLKRQGGVSKAQIAYALNKLADLIDAGEKVANAIKKVLAEFTNESERNEVADYLDKFFEKELAEESNIDNNVNLKEKWQPQTKEELAFQSLSEAFEKSISKESSAARLEGRTMREKLIKENPEIARVAENIKDIYEQLQAKGLIKKEGNCP